MVLKMDNFQIKSIITCCMLLPSTAYAELTNEEVCNLADKEGRLAEVTYAQCTCAMNKADEHLEDDMKLAMVEAMVAGTSPIHAMLARGYKMNVIANTLEKYGEATFADCGPVLSF